MLSELAEAICSGGSNRAMRALRVGWLTAKNACWVAKSPSTSHTLFRPSAACAQNATAVRPVPAVVKTSRVRRSITSASAPPQSPNTTSGIRPNKPARPT